MHYTHAELGFWLGILAEFHQEKVQSCQFQAFPLLLRVGAQLDWGEPAPASRRVRGGEQRCRQERPVHPARLAVPPKAAEVSSVREMHAVGTFVPDKLPLTAK